MGFPLISLLVAGGASVSLLLGIIGCATPQWIYISGYVKSIKYEGDFGLWQMCATQDSLTVCVNFNDVGQHQQFFQITGFIHASRAFSILGIVAAGVCVVLSSLSVYHAYREQLETQKRLTIGLLIAGGILVLMQTIAFAVYIAEMPKVPSSQQYKFSPGYSSILSLFAGLIGIGISVASVFELRGIGQRLPQRLL